MDPDREMSSNRAFEFDLAVALVGLEAEAKAMEKAQRGAERDSEMGIKPGERSTPSEHEIEASISEFMANPPSEKFGTPQRWK